MVNAVRTSVSKINGEDTGASIVDRELRRQHFQPSSHPSANPRGQRELFADCSAYQTVLAIIAHVPTCMATFTFKRLASQRLHIVLAMAWVQTSKAHLVC
jgi:hypothetical protein